MSERDLPIEIRPGVHSRGFHEGPRPVVVDLASRQRVRSLEHDLARARAAIRGLLDAPGKGQDFARMAHTSGCALLGHPEKAGTSACFCTTRSYPGTAT